MKMTKTKNKKFIVIILVLFISIGYAVLTANLGINGQFSLAESNFDVHFEKIEVINNPIEANAPTIDNNGTTITFLGDFDRPGDYYDFSVYAVNDGTIDATIDEIAVTGLTNEIKNYINYSLKYSDDSNVLEDDLLRAGSARKIKVHLEYKYDIDEFIPIDELELSLTIKYVSATGFSSNVWEYEYIDDAQTFYVPKTGTYLLETWGAQGGSYSEELYGGYGGYSVGTIELNKNDKLYLNIGGSGESNIGVSIICNGGYNGGGDSKSYKDLDYSDNTTNPSCGSGGGATHIAYKEGLLKDLSSDIDKIIMVSGGGGGGAYTNAVNFGNGGSGGGYIGNTGTSTARDSTKNGVGTGGTQISGGYNIVQESCGTGSFGLGFSHFSSLCALNTASGGGGGFFGGGGSDINSGGGGSGYIGNSLLSEKSMYCYNCQEPDINDENYDNIKTFSTTNVSEEPISQYAKIGNGYARITFIQ